MNEPTPITVHGRAIKLTIVVEPIEDVTVPMVDEVSHRHRRRFAGLTHYQIENATAPPGQRRRLSDWPASPVVLVVSGVPSNHKAWTSRPRIAGRAQTLTHGAYPAVSLLAARERARASERAIAEGVTDRAKLRAIARGADLVVVPVDPAEIASVPVRDGVPRVHLRVDVAGHKLAADLAAKSVRKAKATIAEHGAANVTCFLQGKMVESRIDECGLAAQPKIKPGGETA